MKKLIDAPIAICDLSTRNPNVLFELGIRQAFDKPVVLIQEIGTPKIFDISPLRYLEYCKELRYHDVLKTQLALKDSIEETVSSESDSENVNSIVKLLALSSARMPELKKGVKGDFAFEVIQAEIRDLRKSIESISIDSARSSKMLPILSSEYERISNSIEKTQLMRSSDTLRLKTLERLARDTEEALRHCDDREHHLAFSKLLRKIQDELPF